MNRIIIPGFNDGSNGGLSARDKCLSEVNKTIKLLEVAVSRRLFNYEKWTIKEEHALNKGIETLSEKAKLLDHGQRDKLRLLIAALEEQEKKGSFKKFKKQF